MESWRPAGCGCSPVPRSRGDELGIDDVRHQEGIEEFSVFHVERRVAVSKNVSQRYQTLFSFFKINKSQDTYGIRIGQYQGSI